MSNERTGTEDEFDLMAYADGLLDDDPARKAHVEERLRASPGDAARVEAYRAQNAALRRCYGWRIDDPVPRYLYTALEGRAARPARAVMQVAAVLVLTTVAGMSGWWIGQSERSDWPPPGFIESSRIGLSGHGVETAHMSTDGAKPVPAGPAAPLNWLSERISLSLRMPDLSGRGYTLVGKETVHVADDRMVRLNYSRPDGRGFSLFLRPWWERRNPKIELERRDDVWLAYWRDGPLASAIAARLPREEVNILAREIRRAMHDRNRVAPKVEPEPPPSGLRGMATGPLSGGTKSPAVPMVPAESRKPGINGGITTN